MKFRVLIDSLLVGQEAQKHFTDSIYYEPEELALDNFAKIFLHIEVLDNPKSSRNITQIILDSVKEVLYKDLKKDPYEAFEEALKVVNKEVNKFKLDDKEWIGKVNATIGVLSGDEIHISTTGKAHVLLERHGKISCVSEGLAPDENDYDNLFLNIASGGLKENDFVIISNSDILQKITEEHIVNAVNNKQLANSVMALEKLLNDRYHSSLLLNIKSAYDNEEIQGIDEEVLSEENDESEEIETQPKENLTKKIDTKKYADKGKYFFKKLKEVFVPPEERKIMDQEIEDGDIFNEQEERKEYRVHTSDENNIAGVERKESLEDIRKAAHLNDREINSSATRAKEGNKFENTISLIKRNFFYSLKGLNTSKRKSSFKKGNLIGIVIIILIGLFAANSIYSKYIENQEIELLREKLLSIDTLIDRAKGRNIIDEKEKAREVLAQVYKELDVLKDSKYLQNEIEEKRNEIDSLSDSINDIIFVEVPKEYANLEAKYSGVKAKEILYLNDDIYVVSEDAILKLILDQVVTIPIDILEEGEIVTRATTFETESSILMFTSFNRIIEFKRDAFTVNTLLSGENWMQANAIGSYGRRIYLLDPGSNQIWKYTKQSSGFSNPEEYKPYEHDISTALDMSIVGDIYMLNKGGEIIRTNSRETQEFDFTDIPQETDLSHATKIDFNPTLKQLFILDPINHRVFITGYRGLYAKQYVLPEMVGEFQDLFINEDSKRLYILTSTKVYEVDLT